MSAKSVPKDVFVQLSSFLAVGNKGSDPDIIARIMPQISIGQIGGGGRPAVDHISIFANYRNGFRVGAQSTLSHQFRGAYPLDAADTEISGSAKSKVDALLRQSGDPLDIADKVLNAYMQSWCSTHNWHGSERFKGWAPIKTGTDDEHLQELLHDIQTDDEGETHTTGMSLAYPVFCDAFLTTPEVLTINTDRSNLDYSKVDIQPIITFCKHPKDDEAQFALNARIMPSRRRGEGEAGIEDFRNDDSKTRTFMALVDLEDRLAAKLEGFAVPIDTSTGKSIQDGFNEGYNSHLQIVKDTVRDWRSSQGLSLNTTVNVDDSSTWRHVQAGDEQSQ